LIDHIFLVIFCILAYEIIIRSNLVQKTKDTHVILRKVLKVLPSKNISDHWKELMVPTYAFMLLRKCLQMFMILVGVILISLVFYALSPSFYDLVLSVLGVLESIAIIYIYNFAKKQI